MKLVAVGVVVAFAACVNSNSVDCGDGGLCPGGTVCDPHSLCVAPDQIAACVGAMENDACTYQGGSGHCIGGTCLPTVCGDGIVEPGEMCDPTDGSMCSRDCTSDLTCGNHIVDIEVGESCDDENHVDNDGCSSSCETELATWAEFAVHPGVRYEAGVAYDLKRDRMVVFGGNLSPTFVQSTSDTIEWNGATWTHVPSRNLPSPRTSLVMAYDSDLGVTVMYGGFDSSFAVGDTWTWDGHDWHAFEGPGPGVRSSAVMAYDAKRKVVVMFGGEDNATPPTADTSTWEWNGMAWTKSTSTGPAWRNFASMAYDPKHGVIVLAGGSDDNMFYNDTWTYDGTWHQMTPSTSPRLSGGAMVWDPSTQRIVLLGGYDGTTRSTIWAWDGAAWTLLAAPLPFPARSAMMAAAVGDHVVVFGGASTVTNPVTLVDETWIYRSSAWTQVVDLGIRNASSVVDDRVSRSADLFGGFVSNSGTPTNETWTITTTGDVKQTGGMPGIRFQSCFAWDYANNNAVMFGGFNGTVDNAETWIWNGSTWTQKFPTHAPSQRFNMACAFDGHRVTLMGGSHLNGTLGDAFSWDGTDWSPVTVPAALTARADAKAAYDPIAKNLVLYGGNTGNVPLVDTWTYDGTAWTARNTGFAPTTRFGAAIAWNPARGHVTIVGGIPNGTDTFEWDGAQWHSVGVAAQPPTRSRAAGYSSLDGGGIVIYGGIEAGGATPANGWELRYLGSKPHERCDGTDADGDGLRGCDDPDCWSICFPACPPSVPNCDKTQGPHCGDGICDGGRETGRTCPADCSVTPVCGDGYCDAGETCPATAEISRMRRTRSHRDRTRSHP